MSTVDRRQRPRLILVRPPPPKPPVSSTSTAVTSGCGLSGGVAVRTPVSTTIQQSTRGLNQGREGERILQATQAPGVVGATSGNAQRGVGVETSRETVLREAQAVAAARASLAQAKAAVDDASGGRGGSKASQEAAALNGARALEAALKDASPAAQRAILAGNEDTIATLTKGLDTLSGDKTTEAIAHLARAGEALGRENIGALAGPMAQSLPALFDGHGDNDNELADGFKSAIKNGDGALLAASVLKDAPAESTTSLSKAVNEGLKDVRDDFEAKANTRDINDGQLAAMQQNWLGSLSPDALDAGARAFRAEHHEVYDDAKRAAEIQASVLDGAGLLSAHQGEIDGETPGRIVGFFGKDGLTSTKGEADKALLNTHRLANDPAGAEALSNALTTQARTGTSFLRDAQGAAASIDDDGDRENAQERLDAAILSGASGAVNARLAERDPVGAVELLRGASATLNDDVLRQGLDGMRTEVETLPQGETVSVDQARGLAASINGSLSGVARERAIGAVVGGLNGIDDTSLADARAQAADDLRTDPRFQKLSVFGAALSVAGLATKGASAVSDPNLRSIVSTATAGTGSAEAGLGVARAFSTTARGSSAVASTATVLGRVNLAAALGFSAFDTASALKRGDELGAGIAAAPIIGAGIGVGVAVAGGAGIGAAVTGPAAPIGAAIGAVVGLGAGILRSKLADSPEEIYEKSTESFLRGALVQDGLPPQAAYRLRNIDGDGAGIAPLLPRFADALGTTPEGLLKGIAHLDDNRQKEAIETILDANDNFESWRDDANRDPLGPTVTDLADRAERLRRLFI